MTPYPDIKTAVAIWQKSISEMSVWIAEQHLREYIFHTVGVGESAAKIASCCNLDYEKAYVLGLLHDYGKKQSQKQTGKSHFMVGYDDLMLLGWSDAARINLTHSFPEQNFDYKDYSSYPFDDLRRAKELIRDIVYDDYDKLIQLCDLFFEGTAIVSFQKRLKNICYRYNLKKEQIARLEKKASENKAYFDVKCGCDVYELLHIEK